MPADTPISVQFDRPVVRSSVAGRFTVAPAIPDCDLTAAFTAKPEDKCAVTWSDGDALFSLQHPLAVLAPDTQYTFTLRGGFRDPSGTVNTVDHTWNISTAGAPQVRSVTPSDGATAVAIDGPITVDFNSGMDAATTEKAITLDPAVPGTQVIRNEKDKSRFMLVPGRLLLPHVTYKLSVARTATDIHGQRLFGAQTVSFTTGALSPGDHGIALARRPNQSPTEVVLTELVPVEDGMPVAAQTVLSAPICSTASGCGAAAQGLPLYTFAAAALSPDDQWLAVVEQDRTTPAAAATLVLLAAASGAFDASFPGGTLPAWSSDGATLAFSQGAAVHLYTPATHAESSLPPGDPLVAPPVWSPSGGLIALDQLTAGGEHVVLADANADARFAVPGLTGDSSTPALSPDGSTLAVYRTGRPDVGTWIVGLGAGAPVARALGAGGIPVGFADRVTLVVRSAPGSGPLSLSRVSLTGGDVIAIPLAVGGTTPQTPVVLAPSGRQLAYLAAPAGVTNAYIVNADGTGAEPLTAYGPGSFEVAAITLS